ncbi:MAG: hypothetical protein ABH824_00455 [Nanoarchaeota archaeon]
MRGIKEELEKTITENCQTCIHNDKGLCDITEEKIGSGDEYCGSIFEDMNRKDGYDIQLQEAEEEYEKDQEAERERFSDQIKKAKQEERERVVKAMTGEYKIIKESYSNELNDFGYNERVREEIEKARTLLT